jgi:hypothetical protein
MLLNNARSTRTISAAVMILAALVAFALGPGHAAASACRTDPIVVLTNGSQLQFGANIGTSYSNVQRVDYTVHGPAHSAPLLIIYTDNPLGSVEVVHYVTDAPSNTYSIDTVVYTGSGTAQVTTSGLLISLLHLTLGTGSASGMNNNHILMPLRH